MANTVFKFDTDGFKYYHDNYVVNPSKTATTGTTGSFPYNGMGRVVLKKNMVSNVNTLTQTMMPTATGGNTVYVIKYDFVLSANITIPENCILEFDGGSISGSHTITGNVTGIRANLNKIFSTNVSFAGTWNILEVFPEWFGTRNSTSINAAVQFASSTNIKKVVLSNATYSITSSIVIGPDLYFGTNCDNIHQSSDTKCVLEAASNIKVISISSSSNLNGITLNGFSIKGYSKTNDNSCGISMEVGTKQAYQNLFKNITITNTRYGIYFSATSGGISYNRFDNIRCDNNVIGLRLEGSNSYFNKSLFINCAFRNCDICGVRINNFNNMRSNTFLNCLFEEIGSCSLSDYNTFSGVQAYCAMATYGSCEFISCSFNNVYPKISGKTDAELITERRNTVILLEKGAGASITNCTIDQYYRVFYVKQYGRVTTKNNMYLQKVSNDIEGLIDINIEISSGSNAGVGYTSIDVTEFEELISSYLGMKKAINSFKAGNTNLWPTQTTSFIMNVNSNYMSDRTINGYGTSAAKPIYIPRGTEYFCTDITPARPIYWTGSAWVDAAGATIS